MEVTDRQRGLLELCAIRVGPQSVDRSLIARQVQDAGGLDDLRQGIITERSAAAERSLPVLRQGPPGATRPRTTAWPRRSPRVVPWCRSSGPPPRQAG